MHVVKTGYANKPTTPPSTLTLVWAQTTVIQQHCNITVVLQQTTHGFGGKVVSTLGKPCFATEETGTLRQFLEETHIVKRASKH